MQSNPSAENELTWTRVFIILLQHRWLVLGVATAFPLMVIAGAFFTAERWQSSAAFMPQAGNSAGRSQLSSLAGQFGIDLGGNDPDQAPEFYANLIVSREILGQVASQQFTLPNAGDSTSAHSTSTLADLLRIDRERAAARKADVVRWLRRDVLEVNVERETGLIEFSVTTPWPRVSAQIAETIITLVNNFNLERRQSQAGAERRFLEARLSDVSTELRSAEGALQSFLQQNRAIENSPALQFERDRLQRQVLTQQQVYTALAQTYEQARIAEIRNTPVITVVERPNFPVDPVPQGLGVKTVLASFLGAIVGALVAFGHAFWIQRTAEADQGFHEMRSLVCEARQEVAGAFRILRRPFAR